MARILYQSDDGFRITNDPNRVALEAFFQELLLWKGENMLDIEKGVDYFAIFNAEAWVKDQVEQVCERWEKYFSSIVVGDIESLDNGETVRVPVTVTLKDSSVVTKTILL